MGTIPTCAAAVGIGSSITVDAMVSHGTDLTHVVALGITLGTAAAVGTSDGISAVEVNGTNSIIGVDSDGPIGILTIGAEVGTGRGTVVVVGNTSVAVGGIIESLCDVAVGIGPVGDVTRSCYVRTIAAEHGSTPTTADDGGITASLYAAAGGIG